MILHLCRVLPNAKVKSKIKHILFAVVCFIFAILPTFQVSAQISWHDQQRIGQIVILSLSGIAFVFVGVRSRFVHSLGWPPVVVLVTFGALACLYAKHKKFAFLEYSLIVATYIFAILMASILRKNALAQTAIICVVVFIAWALELIFLLTYVIGLFRSDLDPFINYYGFSNVRFFGQFQTLTLPLLFMPLLSAKNWCLVGLRLLVYKLTIILWVAMLAANGTRGSWLGVFVVGLVGLMTSSIGRRWSLLVFIYSLAGICVYGFMYHIIPSLLAIELDNVVASRLNFSLSGREGLWLQAIAMVVDKPFLGYGPMHFASLPNAIAAHPHQSILQMASEFGLLVTLVCLYYVAKSICNIFFRIRINNMQSEEVAIKVICLFFAILASLVQSMVDGVFVMPYTLLWFAVCAGWLLSVSSTVHPRSNARSEPDRLLISFKVIACCAVFWLVGFGVVSFKDQSETENIALKYQSSHFQPRFWQQGIIGLAPER